MSTNFDIKKKAMIKAMIQTLGNITESADIVGIHRTTHHKWMQNDPEYKAEIEAIEEMNLDFAESMLKLKMKGKVYTESCVEVSEKGTTTKETIKEVQPDTTAIIFYLKTKGKKRGYVEKSDDDNTPKEIRVTFDDGSSDD